MKFMIRYFYFILCFFSITSYADVINKTCISKSGLSKYNIHINTNQFNGVLDYEFMNQRVTYKLTDLEIKDSIIRGIAVFLSSQTGETKGNSFLFSYDLDKNTLTESNLLYKCV